MTARKKVVIVGGGFAGMKLIDTLLEKYFEILLIDKCNYHQFTPLLYQVATFGLEPSAISIPFRKKFQSKKNFKFRVAEVIKIIPQENLIETTVGSFSYDYLVISAGTQANFFGVKNIENNAFSIKTISDALALRNTILENFEVAVAISDPKERKPYLNIVIAGAGASGVEVAGALAEMKKYIFSKDYPEIDKDELQIYLVESSPCSLSVMSQKSSDCSRKYLEKLGVNLLLNTVVADYCNDTVVLKDRDSIPSKTFIWTTGVKAVCFEGLPTEVLDPKGRIIVNEYNQINNIPNIHAVGDICVQYSDEKYPKGHPQVAQVAIQQGRTLAQNLGRAIKGIQLKKFKYNNKGTLATIGRNKAVADLPFGHMKGFFAWIVWVFLHFAYVTGVKSKIQVVLDWIQEYFTYDDSLRLIIKSKMPQNKK